MLLDGVDVRDWDLQSLRENFAVVLQDVFLFSGTVESNIRLGRADITDERLGSLWLEWKRRTEPSHYLDPAKRAEVWRREEG